MLGAALFAAIATGLIFLVPAEKPPAVQPASTALTSPTGGAQMTERAKGHVVIVHGAYGSPDVNWFPWLSKELRARGVRVDVPTFPTPEGQTLTSWLSAFQQQIGPVTSDMVLVGHSLGPAFILRLLATTPLQVKGTFMVAPFIEPLQIERFDVPNRTFLEGPLDWGSVRERAGFIRIYGSDNDPYVPIDKTDDVAARLGASVTRIHGGAHLNTAAGYTTFPQLLTDLVEFLEK
jgi:predicted alpha/beta hydrolase family esterase